MKPIREIDLRRRILATLVLVALSTLALAGVAYFETHRLSDALYEVGVVRLPSIQGLDRMREAITDFERFESHTAEHRGDSDIAPALERIAHFRREFDAGWAMYAPLPQTSEEAAIWEAFVDVFAGLRTQLDRREETLRSRLEKSAPDRPTVEAPEGSGLAASLEDAGRLLVDLTELNVRIAREAMTDTVETTEDVAKIGNVVIGISLMALLAQLWLAVFLGRSVTRPLVQLQAAVRRIGNGDSSVRVPETGHGEIRRLAKSVNSLARQLEVNEDLRAAIGANLKNSFLYQVRYDRGRGWRYVFASPNLERLTGIPVRTLLADPSIFDTLVVDEDREKLLFAREQTAVTPEPHEYVVRARRGDGAERSFQISSAPRRLPDGTVISDGIVTDITDRIATERALHAAVRAMRTTSRCRQAIACATSEEELLRRVCDSIVEEGGYRLCGVLYRNHDDACTVREVARAGLPHSFPDDAWPRWDEGTLGRGPVGSALRTGEAQVFSDILDDPRCAPWHAAAIAAGVNSIVALPLIEEGEVFGALAIYSGEAGPWAEQEVALLRELGSDLQFGIAALRTRARHDAAVADLMVSEARLRSTIEDSPIAVTLADLDGRFFQVNPAMCRLTGYSEDELKTMSVLDLTYAEDRPATEAFIERARSGSDAAFGLSKRYVRKNGEVVWARPHVSIVCDREGKPSHFVAHIVDETERHEAERNLESSRARMQLTLEMAKLVYFEFDDKAGLVHFDKGFREIFGWPENDAAGVSLTPQEYSQRFLLPEDSRIVEDDIELARRSKKRKYGGSIEHRFRRADGSIGHLSVSRIVDRNDPSGELRLRGAIQDVSAMVELRQQLLQAQKMEAIGQLAGGIAHDFNNYLTVIQGYAQMLFQSLDSDDRRRSRVEAILSAAESSAALTAQLLAFSRREVTAPRRIDLDSLVGDTRSMLARLVGEDIEVTTRSSAAPCAVRIDPGQMRQVLVNLAVNSRDAMPRGGQLAIETEYVEFEDAQHSLRVSIPAGKYIRLSVRDSGVGIPEEVQQQMFDPFYTTKGAGRGTGLGLSVVYGIVQQAGGYIDVESRPGDGTTFRIYLPREGDVPIAHESVPDSAAGRSEATATILIVEDDPAVEELNREILSGEGYTVLCAADGDEALDVAASFDGTIDLVVTDVVLPRRSGAELAAELKNRKPDLRVLFVSGYTDDAVLRQGIAREEVEFLQKPFSAAALLAKVRELLLRDGSPGAT